MVLFMFLKCLKRVSLLFAIAIGSVIPSTVMATSSSNQIQILNKTSDLNIVFGDGSGMGQKTMSFGDYSNDNFKYDYGEGLIKSIFGDFKNITSSADNVDVNKSNFKSQWANQNDQSQELVAGIFYGQAYIIKLLQMAMLKLTTLILFVYGVLFVGAGFWGLAKNGGNEKSVWGSWGSSAVPFKMLFGLILIFPTTSGYTVGQLFHTQLNLLSNYGGRYIYLSAINLLDKDYIKKGVTTVVEDKLKSNIFNVNGLMKDMLRAEYCTLEMNMRAENEYPDAEKVDKAFNFGKSFILLDDQLLINYGPRPKDSSLVMNFIKGKNNELQQKYQAYSARSGKPVDYCGSISIPFSANISSSNKTEFENSVALNNTVSLMHYFALGNSTDIAFKFWADHKGSISELSDGVYTLIARTIDDMERSYVETMKNFTVNGDITQVSSTITTDRGWIFDTNKKISSDVSNELKDYILDNWNGVKPSQREYIKALLALTQKAADNYNVDIVGQSKDYAKPIVNAIFENNDLSPYNKIIAYGYNYGWIDAGGWFSTLSNISIGDKLLNTNSPVSSGVNLAFDKVDGDLSKNQHKVTNSAFSLDIAKYNNLNMFLDPATFKAASVSKMASNILGMSSVGVSTRATNKKDIYTDPFRFEDSTAGVWLAKQIGYDPDTPYIHPLMQLKSSGDKMQSIATYILAGSAIGSFMDTSKDTNATTGVQKGSDSVLAGIDGKGGLLSNLIGKATSLGMMFAVVLALGGFFLGTYLPMLPTIYWTMGVIAWATGMVINFISIPIVGLVMAYSQTEDLAGRTINFFMALIENALRPLIMPIALLVAIVFQALFVSLGSRLITQAYVVSDVGVVSIGIIFFVAMYVVFNYIILTANASLIRIIPEEVNKRINGMAAAGDDSEQISQKLSGTLQQSRSDAQGAMSLMMRSGGR